MLPKTAKILVVDDMPSMWVLIIRVLRELGFTEFVEAADAAKAWELVSPPKSLFGLILADFNMNKSSGLDLLKRMRASERFAKTPFIMMMLEFEIEHEAAIEAAGVSAIIYKPFDAAAMAAS